MSTTITHNSTSIYPVLVLGWESTQETRNIVHAIIGKSSPDVTLKPAALRTGVLSTFWTTAANAETCRALHGQLGTFTLATTELSQVAMTYVVSGAITTKLDSDSQKLWVVDIEYAEITA